MGNQPIFPLLRGSVLRFPIQQQHIDRTTLRDMLLLHARLRVDLHRCADLGVAHQLLHHLDVVAGCSQQLITMD